MTHVGQRIRAVREAKGLSQQHLGKSLGVVHTTIHDYEAAEDLKTGLVKRLAVVLEVHHHYLTGDDPVLDAVDDVTIVVRRESLRLFLDELLPSKAERRQFDRIKDHDAAPRTIEGWRRLHDLLQRFVGRPPGHCADVSAGRDTATLIAAAQPPKMARMKLMTPERKSQRQAG